MYEIGRRFQIADNYKCIMFLFKIFPSVSSCFHFQTTTVDGLVAQSSPYHLRKLREILLSSAASEARISRSHQLFNRILAEEGCDGSQTFRHRRIDCITGFHCTSPSKEDSDLLTFYRGKQIITIIEDRKLKYGVEEVGTNRPFLSTSMKRQIVNFFAGENFKGNCHISYILLKNYLHTKQSTQAYPFISSVPDDELLLSFETKFIPVAHQKLYHKRFQGNYISNVGTDTSDMSLKSSSSPPRLLQLWRYLFDDSHLQNTVEKAFTILSAQFNYRELKRFEEICATCTYSNILNYYTQNTLFHRVLNYILRQQRYDIFYPFRYLIIALIFSLYRPLPSKEDSVFLTLCRGQQMTRFEVEKLKNCVGEIIYNLPFLSTSTSRQIADIFAGKGFDNHCYLVSVIFEIHLDTGQPIRPYALINNSAEEEVLLSPGIKFILVSCRKLHDDGSLWHFELKAIPEERQEQIKSMYGKTFSQSDENKWMADIGRGSSLQNHLMRPLSKVETGFEK